MESKVSNQISHLRLCRELIQKKCVSDEKEVHPIQGIKSILGWCLGLWGIEPKVCTFLEEIFKVKDIQLSG